MQSCGMGVVKRLNGERVNIERHPLWSQNREPPPVKSKLQSNPLNTTQYSRHTRDLRYQTLQILWDANTSCEVRIANQSLNYYTMHKVRIIVSDVSTANSVRAAMLIRADLCLAQYCKSLKCTYKKLAMLQSTCSAVNCNGAKTESA